MARTTTTTPTILDAYSIPQFCAAHSISRGQFYALRKKGMGPAETKLIGRIVITRESAAAWRRRHTTPARARQVREAAPTASPPDAVA
jgi:hypothetical protein